MNLLGIEVIIEAACLQTGVTLEQLVSKRRHADIVATREIICVLLRDIKPGFISGTQPSLPDIARAINRHGHSGVFMAAGRARLAPHIREHARQVCERLAIPRSHWPAWMVGSTQEVSHACS